MAPFKVMELGELRARCGALPCPQSQIALAGGLPAAIRAWLTGWRCEHLGRLAHQLVEQLGTRASRADGRRRADRGGREAGRSRSRR